MTAGNLSSVSLGWVAIATGVTGLLGLAFIILFFTVGQPFGTLNDICIGLTAILSAILAWMVYAGHHAQLPLQSRVALMLAVFGAIVVVVGSVLVISGITGWYLAGLYMAAGNGLIGLWLLGLNYSALSGTPWSYGLAIFGLISGVIMALGLLTTPGILGGIDSQESASWIVNYVGQAGGLGWLVLYPIWCVLVGRVLVA
ncbi:MAG TPA: hypothetical protein VJK02_18905 [Anaerolineales bacterium]|nr:hypothetical protein [Anaerolineales bacterium]